MSDEGFENLRMAILRQAATDYIKALKKDNKREAHKIERFFKSDWGEYLSGGHGEFIIDECKRRANMRRNAT